MRQLRHRRLVLHPPRLPQPEHVRRRLHQARRRRQQPIHCADSIRGSRSGRRDCLAERGHHRVPREGLRRVVVQPAQVRLSRPVHPPRSLPGHLRPKVDRKQVGGLPRTVG